MTPVERFVARLGKVKGRNGSWTALCPAHEDKTPSLSIREGQDGRVLVHCFGGCEVYNIVGSVGMDLTDLFPPKDDRPRDVANKRLPFFATDLLKIAAFEALVVMVAAFDLSRGKTLSQADRERMVLAQQRLEEVVQYAGL